MRLIDWQAGLLDEIHGFHSNVGEQECVAVKGVEKVATKLDGESIQSLFLNNGSLACTTPDRLPAYQNNYQQALLNRLESVFERVHSLLGPQYFQQLIAHYVINYPLVSGDLGSYGENFSDYLGMHQAHRSELSDLGYLADIAKYDWLVNRGYYQSDEDSWPADRFQTLSIDDQVSSRLVLSARLEVIKSAWSLLEIISVAEGKSGEMSLGGAGSHMSMFLLYRPEFKTVMVQLSETEQVFLLKVREGFTVGQLSEFHEDFSSMMVDWIQKGWINDFTFKDNVVESDVDDGYVLEGGLCGGEIVDD